jgi:hypothetical protein
MNHRAVSAPYEAIISSGSTVLRFDFDIFSIGPISIGSPVAASLARLVSSVPSMMTSAGAAQLPSALR